MKLWQKGNQTNLMVEKFTVGNDPEFDIQLAEFDVLGNIAHARMIASIGLITQRELSDLERELKKIYATVKKGDFSIAEGIEDVHSQVEYLLTESLGETGKKIHVGRSRNDQVLVDLKLFLREETRSLVQHVESLFELLVRQSEKYKSRLMPGYTHFQVAMPSSFGLWFGSFAESLCDDLEMLHAAYVILDKNPLGSAAGYGSSFPLKRQMTTDLLGFASMNYNAAYAQMTRGKSEKVLAMGMACVAATLVKLSYDACLFMNQEFGFIKFPDELTTGSSIMPHKKNPDVFELIRARCNRIQAVPNELALLTGNLPSGYHRDLQLSKEILFPAIRSLKDCLDMTGLMLANIVIRENILSEGKYDVLYSVESVNQLVMQGVPFRDAYKQVAETIAKGNFRRPETVNYTHEGSIGNLNNAQIMKQFEQVLAKFAFNDKMKELVS